jgi:predicted methyltransferase
MASPPELSGSEHSAASDSSRPQHPVATDRPRTAAEILAGMPTGDDARRFLAETDRSLLEILRDGPNTPEESVIYRGVLSESSHRLSELNSRRLAGVSH